MTLDQYIEFIEKVGIAFGGTMLLIAIVLISIIGFAFIFTFLLDLARDCFHSQGQSK